MKNVVIMCASPCVAVKQIQNLKEFLEKNNLVTYCEINNFFSSKEIVDYSLEGVLSRPISEFKTEKEKRAKKESKISFLIDLSIGKNHVISNVLTELADVIILIDIAIDQIEVICETQETDIDQTNLWKKKATLLYIADKLDWEICFYNGEENLNKELTFILAKIQ